MIAKALITGIKDKWRGWMMYCSDFARPKSPNTRRARIMEPGMKERGLRAKAEVATILCIKPIEGILRKFTQPESEERHREFEDENGNKRIVQRIKCFSR